MWLIFLKQQKNATNFFFLFTECCQVSCLELKKKIFQCITMAICHVQERHTHQLSNIRHQNTVCKSYYWTRSNIMLDSLHSGPCQSGWVIFWEGGGERDCQADSPQVSSQQWAVNKLLWPGWPAAFPFPETCLTLPHRPGSRWPLAAGLAHSSVHYRAAMDKTTVN